MPSALKNFFFGTPIPNNAAGFVGDSFVVVSLRRTRTGSELLSSALTSLPEGLVTPSFDSTNIQDADQLVQVVAQTAEAAGMANKRRWSAALPDATVRTVIVTLEGKPTSRHELNELISWKTERAVGTPSSELRLSKQKLARAGGQDRYLVTVARENILQEYEALFTRVGWQTGILLPKYIGETQWLMLGERNTVKMLVSSNSIGFTSVVVKGSEVVLVRAHECDSDSVFDELYRVALYYRDRMAAGGPRPESAAIEKLLLTGDIDAHRAISAVSEATGEGTQIIDPAELGLDLTGEPVSFGQLAGVAGLCTLAWA